MFLEPIFPWRELFWSATQPGHSSWFSFITHLRSVFIFFLLHIHLGVVGNFCNSGSAGLPHSVGRAHFIRGTIIYGYNDGKCKEPDVLKHAPCHLPPLPAYVFFLLFPPVHLCLIC